MSNETNQNDLEGHKGAAAANAERVDLVNVRIDAAQGELERSGQQLADIERELEALASERQRYVLLQQAVDAVRHLDAAGLADVFWGETLGVTRGGAQLIAVEQEIAQFSARVEAVDAQRQQAAQTVHGHHAALDLLADDLFGLEQERENQLQDWVVEREATPLPAGPQVMPWVRGLEEDRQFRRFLGGSLAVSLLLALLIPLVELPIPERDELIELPTRFAKLIAPPPVATPPEAPAPEPQELAVKKPEPQAKPQPQIVQAQTVSEPEAVQAEPESVASKGILAFRERFSDLASNRPATQIGAKARIRGAGEHASRPQRNLITTLASGSSGGINLAAVSRDLGGGGGAMIGVQTAQVASSIAAAGGGDRPRSGGAIAGRTDEEIQIVFDRYKAALYRLYNRELRKDPTLRGQLVLELTIEPGGSVSFIALQSSNMNAPVLAEQVVHRVSGFDFGAKDVPAVTIVYPIDFLPTA